MDILEVEIVNNYIASSENYSLSPRSINAIPTISVVAPAFNEQEVLEEFHRRVTAVLSDLNAVYEILLINDGSNDQTLNVMHKIRNVDPHVSIIDLSRNFGKEIALTAGLDQACGEVIIILDSDLQDPPELIPLLLDGWREGFDIVYGCRTHRDGETWLKKTTAKNFYRLIQKVSRVKIPKDTGDFRLMTQRTVRELSKLREEHRFMKGLFAWIGFPSKPIFYRRDPRVAGQTKWNYWKLLDLAIEGITSFSTAPLKLASYLGLSVALLALLYAVILIWKTIVFGNPARGYPSIMVTMLFLGGVQLISVGVLGEYIGRIFNEVKQRPLYLINKISNSDLKIKHSISITQDLNATIYI